MAKRPLCLALSFVLVPAAAWADRHKAGLRAAYTDADRSDLKGMSFGGEWELHGDDPTSDWTFSLVAEASLVNGPHGVDSYLDQFTLVAGPRYTYGHGQVQFFGQALAGFGRLSGGAVRTPPVFALGAGFDVPLGRTASGKHPRSAIRFQWDQYYIRDRPSDWYRQITVGVVVRFNRHDSKKPCGWQALPRLGGALLLQALPRHKDDGSRQLPLTNYVN